MIDYRIRRKSGGKQSKAKLSNEIKSADARRLKLGTFSKKLNGLFRFNCRI